MGHPLRVAVLVAVIAGAAAAASVTFTGATAHGRRGVRGGLPGP